MTLDKNINTSYSFMTLVQFTISSPIEFRLLSNLHIYYKKLVYKKRVLGRSKNQETLVLCSRKNNKLCYTISFKKEYIGLLKLVNLCDLEKTVTCYFDLLGHFS